MLGRKKIFFFAAHFIITLLVSLRKLKSNAISHAMHKLVNIYYKLKHVQGRLDDLRHQMWCLIIKGLTHHNVSSANGFRVKTNKN